MDNLKWQITKVIISLKLDYLTMGLPFLSWPQKVDLIFKKYFILISYYLLGQKFVFGRSAATVWDHKLIYEQAEGLVRLQSIFVRHLTMIDQESVGPMNNVVDIGANVGHFSRAIKMKYPNARITAIEPVPQVMQVCQQNLSDLKGSIEFIQIAVGDKNGVVKMASDPAHVAESQISEIGDIEVRMKTLDEALERSAQIDLMKIDVEGFEHMVLKNGQAALSKTKYLLMETSRYSQTSFSDLVSHLKGPNYEFQLKGVILYRSPHGPYQFSLADMLFENFVLTKRPHNI